MDTTWKIIFITAPSSVFVADVVREALDNRVPYGIGTGLGDTLAVAIFVGTAFGFCKALGRKKRKLIMLRGFGCATATWFLISVIIVAVRG